jgi:alkanesulfonate monooxygenase SsuD/methylene tetrahydromethanopterin reductase-like flavin-dependent oxidoreductase (luciferase family)
VIGGNGVKWTLPLVVQYADEWNAYLMAPLEYARLNAMLDEMLQQAGRQPEHVRRSLMTACIFQRDYSSLEHAVTQRYQGRYTITSLRQRGAVAATTQDAREVLLPFQQAGVQCIMLQWLDLDDLAGLEALARAVLPFSA